MASSSDGGWTDGLCVPFRTSYWPLARRRMRRRCLSVSAQRAPASLMRRRSGVDDTVNVVVIGVDGGDARSNWPETKAGRLEQRRKGISGFAVAEPLEASR